jgi:hypothetical protein
MCPFIFVYGVKVEERAYPPWRTCPLVIMQLFLDEFRIGGGIKQTFKFTGVAHPDLDYP